MPLLWSEAASVPGKCCLSPHSAPSGNRRQARSEVIKNNKVIVSYKEYQENSSEILFLSVNQRRKLIYEDNKVYITFLAPNKDKVQKLYNYYDFYKTNGKKRSDDAEIVNRSSIMFILEYHRNAILMAGDGYISDIITSIEQLADSSQTMYPIRKFDLIKLPHHGSDDNNCCLEQLIQYTPCNKFVITNGNRGSVNISEKLKEILFGKNVYISEECEKFKGMNYIITKENEVITDEY